MSLQKLIDIIHSGNTQNWNTRNEDAFKDLFGSPEGRYPVSAEKVVKLKAPEISDPPFASYIHPSNPSSGAYGGFSFVIFPASGERSLIGLVVGTAGLAPDEFILGRPGHARKARAICSWLNKEFGKGELVAWAKHDPTQIEITVPENIQKAWSPFKSVFDVYGTVIYAVFRPTPERAVTSQALTAFLDLMFEERGYHPNKSHIPNRDQIRSKWFDNLMPQVNRAEIKNLLQERRFVVLQGPPGTGKTKMATDLLDADYVGCGISVQFHPNTTYETVIGGLAPEQSKEALGLQFRTKPGFLMRAVIEASQISPKPYLLHIDEINRADLGKVLGEAIYLLEPKDLSKRKITLPYDFGEPFNDKLTLPQNLHVLGTMNSADRSIAIVDVAIRRRFAFLSLWPQMSVVSENGCELMQSAFRELLLIFVEHAPEIAFNLAPGHSYFLEHDEGKARASLKVNLAPLLEEYLAQGYVSGFSEQIRSYLQWVHSL